MLEMLKNYFMERMADKGESVKKWKHSVLPKAMEIMNKNKEWIKHSRIKRSGDLYFQVKMTNSGEQFVCDLNSKTCSCRKWELIGILCTHALACIL